MECKIFGAPLDDDDLKQELNEMVTKDAIQELGQLSELPDLHVIEIKEAPIE